MFIYNLPHQYFAILLLLFIGSINPPKVSGQSSILDQYVEQAKNQNLVIQSNHIEKKIQQNRIQQASKLWGPSVDLSASYLFAQGGRNIIFPIGDLFNPTYNTLNQLTGTSQFPTNLANEEIQLTPNNFLDAQISVSKPLINSAIKYNQLIQKELLRFSDISREITEKDITYQLKNSYYNYLKTIEGLNIIDENQALLTEVLEFNKKLVKYDKATSEIISDVEYQIEALKSQRAQLNAQNELSKSSVNLLLNEPLDHDLMIDGYIVNTIDFTTESIESLYDIGLQNRNEFQQLEVSNSVNDLNKERIQKEKNPTVGINGGIGIQTEKFDFDAGGPLFTLGIGMQMNIFDNGQRKKRIEELTIQKELIENTRAQLIQKVEIEILQSYLALQSTLSLLQSQEAALKSAQNSYKLIKTRYENDKALLIELLQAQNRLVTSELNMALTKYDYLSHQALLEKSLGR